jgi:nucleoside diphosphate kinase
MTAARGSFWDDHVFVLASPDALRRGLSALLIGRLRQEGFVPVAGRLVRTRPEMIDELYADVIAGQWQTWRYRLVDRAFELGPCLAMLCRYHGRAGDPHAVLRERKGDSQPHLAQPGTIRKDLGAINSILGVMHSSDEPEQSRKDSAVYGLSETDDFTADQDVDYLGELSVPAAPEKRDYEAVLADVRARVLASLWHRLPGPLHHKLRAEFQGSSCLAAMDAGSTLRGLLGGVLPDDILTVLGCEFTPQWREDNPGIDVFGLLRRQDTELDSWERLVLETSLYFPSVRRPLQAGDTG